MKVTLTHYTENPIGAIEDAACNCYDSKPMDGKIAEACYKEGHHAVWEFADFTFHIEGVSRSLLAQLTRHRVGVSFAVRSQRYCKETVPTYVTPPSVEKNPLAKQEFDQVMKDIWGHYNKFVNLGIPPEDARAILPNACTTTLECKMNGRELINFMGLRLCTRAQKEIRDLATMMRQCVIEVAPEFKDKLVPRCEQGKVKYCPERNSCGRQKTAKQINEILNSKE